LILSLVAALLLGTAAPLLAQMPPPPQNLVATGGSAHVDLTWNSPASNFNVKRSTVAGGPYTTIGTAIQTSYTDTTVAPGVTYYYLVTAGL